MYLQGTNIGTNVYFLKGKRPIDSFCIFISESVVTFTLLYFTANISVKLHCICFQVSLTVFCIV